MYFVKHADPKALPLFKGTFAQVVKWCLKAQKNDLLPHDRYEIRGGDLKGDPPNLVCEFEIERQPELETVEDLL